VGARAVLPWRPLLAGDESARAGEAVAAIAAALAADGRPLPSSLGAGEAGVALFFAYLALAHADEAWAEQAALRLVRAAASLPGGEPALELFSGHLGVGWASAHLAAALPDLDGEEFCAALDRTLGESLEHHRGWASGALVGGLAGAAVYALERPAKTAAACRADLARRLALAAERPPAAAEPLGVAHGAAAAIPILAQYGRRDDAARTISRLLEQRRDPAAGSVFPVAVGSDEPSSLAWCEGDPGIAAVLLVAAGATGEPAWEEEALAIARAAARRPPAAAGVHDACLCHGAAGLGHLFNRLHQTTGDPELATAARSWLVRALDLRRPGQGIGGYETRGPLGDGRVGWRPDRGLLTGAAGIGLALLAATTAVEPAWDRALLLSPAPAYTAEIKL